MNLLREEKINGIAKEVLPSDTEYMIRKSDNTNSIYLTIRYYDWETTIRFSDHKQYRNNIKTMLVADNTKRKTIYNTIQKSYNGIKMLHLKQTLGLPIKPLGIPIKETKE